MDATTTVAIRRTSPGRLQRGRRPRRRTKAVALGAIVALVLVVTACVGPAKQWSRAITVLCTRYNAAGVVLTSFTTTVTIRITAPEWTDPDEDNTISSPVVSGLGSSSDGIGVQFAVIGASPTSVTFIRQVGQSQFDGPREVHVVAQSGQNVKLRLSVLEILHPVGGTYTFDQCFPISLLNAIVARVPVRGNAPPTSQMAAPVGVGHTGVWWSPAPDQFSPYHVWEFYPLSRTGVQKVYTPSGIGGPIITQFNFSYTTSGSSPSSVTRRAIPTSSRCRATTSPTTSSTST
jgi:hypothetical protein